MRFDSPTRIFNWLWGFHFEIFALQPIKDPLFRIKMVPELQRTSLWFASHGFVAFQTHPRLASKIGPICGNYRHESHLRKFPKSVKICSERHESKFRSHTISCCTEEAGLSHERDESHRLLSQNDEHNQILSQRDECIVPVACHEPNLCRGTCRIGWMSTHELTNHNSR